MQIPSTKPFFSEEDIQNITKEIRDILQSGRLILGPYTRQFEEAFGEYCGVKYAIGVSSCTAALEIALRYFDVSGKEVIVPTNTFVATGNAVIFAGGKPVLADMRQDTLCLDPADLKVRITDKTKGVIVVHVAGLPCPDIGEIREICQTRGLFLLEDVAHAHGSIIDGKKTGSIGDAGCFSFYPTKVMTTCTGGMITTNDEKLAEFAVSMRHHGVGKGLHHIVNLGYDWLMSEISALLGIYQLKALEDNILRRNEIARRYTEALEGYAGIKIIKTSDKARHSYYKYPILLAKGTNIADFKGRMQSEYGISIGSVYDPPCHQQPIYQELFGSCYGMYPVADEILGRICCLPIFPQMTNEEIEYTIHSVKDCLKTQ